MLRARILTAVIVLFCFWRHCFTYQRFSGWCCLLALTAAGAWEWSRLARFSLNYSIFYLLFTIFLAGELLFVLGDAVLADPYTTALEPVLFRLGGVLDFVCSIFPEDKASDQEPAGPRVDGLAGAIAYVTCLIPVARHRSASSAGLHVHHLDIGYRRVFYGARMGKA